MAGRDPEFVQTLWRREKISYPCQKRTTVLPFPSLYCSCYIVSETV